MASPRTAARLFLLLVCFCLVVDHVIGATTRPPTVAPTTIKLTTAAAAVTTAPPTGTAAPVTSPPAPPTTQTQTAATQVTTVPPVKPTTAQQTTPPPPPPRPTTAGLQDTTVPPTPPRSTGMQPTTASTSVPPRPPPKAKSNDNKDGVIAGVTIAVVAAVLFAFTITVYYFVRAAAKSQAAALTGIQANPPQVQQQPGPQRYTNRNLSDFQPTKVDMVRQTRPATYDYYGPAPGLTPQNAINSSPYQPVYSSRYSAGAGGVGGGQYPQFNGPMQRQVVYNN